MNLTIRVAAGVMATTAMLLFTSTALAQQGGGGGGNAPPQQPQQAPAKIHIKVNGLHGGKAKVGDRVEAIVTVTPFVPHQKIEIRLQNRGDTVAKATPYIRQVKGKKFGRAKLRSKPLIDAGKYRIRVSKAATTNQRGGLARSKAFGLKFPDLDPGDRGPAVKLFNQLLRNEAYYDTDGHHYGSHTQRAVMAFRKVNGMARNYNATPEIFKALAAGKGGFKPAHTGSSSGKHVEVDMSRQVMALVGADGKAQYVFMVSTGAAATPSDPGGFTFYSKTPGYNSLGMYYTSYYNRGEGVHGYHSVPPYPASHGCIRTPIPDAIFIYNWIDLGDKMFVYV
jgi:hypothetical protein